MCKDPTPCTEDALDCGCVVCPACDDTVVTCKKHTLSPRTKVRWTAHLDDHKDIQF